MKKRSQSLKGLDIFDFVVMMAAGFADDRRVKAKRTPKEKAETAVQLGVNEWAKVYRKEQPANFILAEHFDARSRARAIQEVMGQWEEEGSLDEEAFDARYAPRGRYTLAKSEAQRILKKASRDGQFRRAVIERIKKAGIIHTPGDIPLTGDILVHVEFDNDSYVELTFLSGRSVIVPVYADGLPPNEKWSLSGTSNWRRPLELGSKQLAKGYAKALQALCVEQFGPYDQKPLDVDFKSQKAIEDFVEDRRKEREERMSRPERDWSFSKPRSMLALVSHEEGNT